jgi:methionyl-tRNA formyltransferase
MRFGFVTCVQLGLSCMEEIYRVGGWLDLAVTLPDDRARTKSGRVYIDDFCRARGIPLIKSPNVNDAAVLDAVAEAELDWLFIIGWSQIARAPLLALPKRGVLGIHPTLLPQGRGRASIPWTILKGLPRTGVTLFKMDAGVDTGPILAQEELPVGADETARSLYDRVNAAHRTLIARAWPDLVADRLDPQPQDERHASTWPGRGPEDGRIDPASMTVAETDRLVRAVTDPYPGAFVDLPQGRLRVWAGTPQAPGADAGAPVAIALRDGAYYATRYAWEPLPEASA